MATGFYHGDIDFDDLFELNNRVPAWANELPATGFDIDGVDLANRYVRASRGTPVGPIGIDSDLVGDLGNFWARKGSVAYTRDPWNLNFEEGPDEGWEMGPHSRIVTGRARNGSWCGHGLYYGQRKDIDPSSLDFVNKGRMRVDPGQYVSITGYMRPTGSDDEVGGSFYMRFFDANLNFVNVYAGGGTGQQAGGHPTTNWAEIHRGSHWHYLTRMNVLAPAGVHYVTIGAHGWIVWPRSNGRLDIDDLTIQVTSAPVGGVGGVGGGGVGGGGVGGGGVGGVRPPMVQQ